MLVSPHKVKRTVWQLAYEISATCLAQWKHRSAQVIQTWMDRQIDRQIYFQCVRLALKL